MHYFVRDGRFAVPEPLSILLRYYVLWSYSSILFSIGKEFHIMAHRNRPGNFSYLIYAVHRGFYDNHDAKCVQSSLLANR